MTTTAPKPAPTLAEALALIRDRLESIQRGSTVTGRWLIAGDDDNADEEAEAPEGSDYQTNPNEPPPGFYIEGDEEPTDEHPTPAAWFSYTEDEQAQWLEIVADHAAEALAALNTIQHPES